MDKFDQSRSRGFAFVKCATQADADKIIADFSEKEFMGRPLRVNMAGQGKNWGFLVEVHRRTKALGRLSCTSDHWLGRRATRI